MLWGSVVREIATNSTLGPKAKRAGLPPLRWKTAVAALVAVAAYGASAQPTGAPSAGLQQERQDVLQGIDAYVPLELVIKARRQCASGQDPRAKTRTRSLGSDAAPDSSDHCPALLARVGREGGLLDLYRELIVKLGGAHERHEGLPMSIAATVMTPGSNQVPIGNQRAAIVSAALALDAGFTVAYRKGERHSPAMPGLSVLKPIAERCLALSEQDLGLCYSTGYVYGARAISGQPLTAP